ncbi:hypothetical protein Dda_4087 [Drechslerella dactyloides]|uniref:RmlD-like substrate binding domain-containing protein n=1 Tax=Drechslerella dactyloides TaxID=74499 RepID=A0AAD6J3J8_DREDA|nr:hypothetical protein Dda_4087 [Drechslerella dactyloides]
MAKKVIVTGATGLLGRQVVRAFDEAGWEVTGTAVDEFIYTGFSRAKPPQILKVNLSDGDEVGKLLDEVKPQVLVHCAAEKSPDRCANDPVGTKQLNIEASRLLAEQTASRDVLLIYISTDYVFDGTPGAAPYEADAETNPPNFYGETKRDGEKAVLGGSNRAVVLRVPLLYGSGENHESAVNTLMDVIWNKSGEDRISMEHWAIRYPTNTEDVARVLKDIAEKYTTTDISTLPRTLQFSSEDRCTKYEICENLSQVLALPISHIVANDKVDTNSSGESNNPDI